MNSRWTFTDQVNRHGQVARFVAFAALGLVVNTAVFLFLVRYLPLVSSFGPITNINLAKLGGVVCAMAMTFIGYRFGVFYSAAIVDFRNNCRLSPATGPLPWRWIGAILALGLAARLGFVAIAPVAYGDAVNYSWVAWLTAHGQWHLADSFWHSLFDYWQALLILTGIDQYTALVLASLIPGTLLLLPVYLVGRRLYGDMAALIASLLAALHPRLIEYSVNGYAEAFYLCGAMWAVWGVTAIVQNPGGGARGAYSAVGLGMAGYFLVRNEAILLVGLLCAVVVVSAQYDKRWLSWRPVAIFLGCVVAYAAANNALWSNYGLFAKASNLGKQHVETLDLASAARETYGATQTAQTDPSLGDTLQALASRWPRNLMYTAERLPGMLLSPVFILTLLLPLLVSGRGASTWDELPLLAFTVWPLIFYPLIQLEPRLLFPTLIGVSIFGAAGAVAAGRLIASAMNRQGLAGRLAEHGVSALLVLLLVPLIPALAWNSEQSRGYHRDVGAWLATHVPADTAITGDGYGYISSSAFWAGRQGEPRLWTDNAATLVASAIERQQPVLVLYEEYLRNANPELLAVLDDGMPGMQLATDFTFPRVGRVQVWTLMEALD
jgi:hypothetical protein